MDKKIIVLVMYCNSPFFIEQERACRNTWGKKILDGKYSNIEYWSYTACSDGVKEHVDFDEHRVYVNTGDGIYETFQKTERCLRLLREEGVEYDFIYRTNTSVVLNVGLLNCFVNSITDDTIVYGGELYSMDVPCPLPHYPYLRGNSIILSKKVVDIILSFGKYVVVPDSIFADDNIIGNIMNCYHMMRYESKYKYVKSYGFAWYKSTKKEKTRMQNGISAWNNTNDSYEYLKNFIGIQIKSYDERGVENERIKHISDIVNVDKDDYSEEMKFIYEYMDDPYIYYFDRKDKTVIYIKLNEALNHK